MVESHDPPPGYVTQSRDTSYWAERMLIEHWRTLEPWEKAREVSSLTAAAHRIALQGLRQRHPGASEEELALLSAAQRLGSDVVKRWTGFDADAG